MARANNPKPLSHANAVAFGKLGGLTKSTRHDGVAATEKARNVWLASFEDQVDPEHVLPAKERQRRAEAAKKLHYTRLAQKGVAARRRKAAAREKATQEVAA